MISSQPSHGRSTLRLYKMHAIWLAILLLAAGLRLLALTRDVRFHPDEALFTTFARSAALNGAWMLPGPLDKPPLSIYASALVLTSFAAPGANPALPDVSTRAGEIAARLPGMIASLLTVALMHPLTRRLYPHDRRVGLAAGLLLAVSPLAVFYSGTAFTDGLMVFFVVLGMTLAAGGRNFGTGLALGFAFASKQQALMLAPLVGIGWLAYGARTGFHWRGLIRLGVGALIPVAALLVWDAARAQPQTMMELAAANNDVWRLLWPFEVLPRLVWFGTIINEWFGVPTISAIVVGGAIGAALGRIHQRAKQFHTWVDVLLVSFILAYVGLHWLVAFNLYDRYLLPLLVPVLMLVGRLYGDIHARLPRLAVWVGGIFVAGALMGSMGGVRNVRISDASGVAYSRIDWLATQLNSEPLGTIIYDPWLGWELGYYMGQWTDKRRVYYPTPSELARGATEQPDLAPRLFIAPTWQPHQRWLDALRTAGFKVRLVTQAYNFTIWRLIPPVVSDG